MQKYGISDFRITIIFVLISIMGYFLISRLNIRLNPVTSGANIYISYSLQGASPEIIDTKIASPIEEKISLLNGIDEIQTHSFNHHGYINISLDKYADADLLRLEIATAIRQIKDKFPQNASYPKVSLHNPDDDSQTAFLIYQINADRKAFDIKKMIDRMLMPAITALPQVDKVEINGYRALEYVIKYDKNQLNDYQLSTRQIQQAVRQYFDIMSLGKLQFSGNYITAVINNSKNFDWHIPVAKKQGRIIYLTDIAQINLQEQPVTSYFRINGKTSLSLSIFPVKSANTIVLQKQIEKIIERQADLFPPDFNLIKTYDSTEYLQNELNKIYKRSFWVVVILLLFVLIVSRSFKYFLIIVLSLSANLGIAFLLYYLFDIQIQLYSLAGITISFGLMIDNSIVMIDHLRNKRNSKIFLPVLASTLTTMAALIGIFFLKDEMKKNLIDFAYVIIINLFVSLWVALLLIPALVRKFHLSNTQKEKKKEKGLFWQNIYDRFIRTNIRYKKYWITFIILLFGLPVFMLPQKIDADNFWAQTYNKTLGNGWYLEKVRPYIDRYLGGSLRLFSQYVFESATYRDNEETKLYVLAQMDKGSNLDQMNEVFLSLDNYLSQFPQIKTFKTDVYQSGFAQIEITFKDKHGEFAYQLKSALIRKALDWGGIHWNIYGVGRGFNNAVSSIGNYNFQIESVGYNYEHLNRWIDTLKTALYKHPRINKINISSSAYPRKMKNAYYQLKFHNDKLAMLGVTSDYINSEINDLSLNLSPSLYVSINGYNYPVRLQSQQSVSFDMWQLMNTPLIIQDKILKIKNLADVTLQKLPLKIYKKDQEYIKYINVQYTGATKFGRKAIQHKIDLLQSRLPLGIKFKLEDRQYLFSQDKQHYYYLLFLVIVLIWGISAVFFESFKQSFIVISLIPVSFIGIFLIFYLFDFNFDQGGIAGFILVSGITVNAVYYLLNDYNYYRKHKKISDYNAYSKAFRHKIFPILLTILSTVLGFLPFILDGQNEVFWFSLAIATMGGLVFSIIGILVYLPIFVLKK